MGAIHSVSMRCSFGLYGRIETERERDRREFNKDSESGEWSCEGENEWREETSEGVSGELGSGDETSEGVNSPSSFVSRLFELEDAI